MTSYDLSEDDDLYGH